MASEPKFTPGPFQVEAVSDAVRVFVRLAKTNSVGKQKVIIARMAPPQLPESETWSNGCLFAAAPDLYAALSALDPGESLHVTHSPSSGCLICSGRRALAKARGEQS